MNVTIPKSARLFAAVCGTLLIAQPSLARTLRPIPQGDMIVRITLAMNSSSYLSWYANAVVGAVNSGQVPPAFDPSAAAGYGHGDEPNYPPYEPPYDPQAPVDLPDTREQDMLAQQGLGWFGRSQGHANLRLNQALQAAQFGNTAQANVHIGEACEDYDESVTALGGAAVGAAIQTVGFITTSLIETVLTPVNSVRTNLCQ